MPRQLMLSQGILDDPEMARFIGAMPADLSVVLVANPNHRSVQRLLRVESARRRVDTVVDRRAIASYLAQQARGDLILVASTADEMALVCSAFVQLPLRQRKQKRLIPIGVAPSMAQRRKLDADAWFLARDLDELERLVVTPPAAFGLSVVLIAFNEEDAIRRAILDIRRFCQLFVPDYEIVVVDDGSTDQTLERAKLFDQGDLHFVRHRHNLGIGASRRDGYAVSEKAFRVHLPADRQVRAHSLIHFLPFVDPEQAVYSTYLVPHTGGRRAMMSGVFRWMRDHVGGFAVDYSGTYLFHRKWWDCIDHRKAISDSFIYSYELLHQFYLAGCRFRCVPIEPYLRDSGKSKVDSPKRIARVVREMVQSRLRRITLDRDPH